jgi:ketosteroid isomerase-like protein
MGGATSAAKGAKSVVLRRAIQWGWAGALVAGVLIAVLVVGPKAQPRPPLPSGADAPVLAVDEALGEAMRAGDRGVARRLLALEFTFVDADGKVHTRKDFLADLKGVAAGPPSDVSVKIYGLVAMVTGHRKSVRGDDAFFLDIWAKQKRAWRILVMQEVPLAAAEASTATAPAAPGTQTKSSECKNPCLAIPYRVRSPAEQDIVDSFQATEKAVMAHDAGEWSKHVADDFVLYGSGGTPVPKTARVAMIERQKESNAAVAVGEVESMEVSAYGDGAVMVATQMMPDDSRARFRAVRVWTRRNGQWQMAVSAHTQIK